jgi:SAM-dependent methyltransferase
MMRTLLDIVDRVPDPAPWSEGDNIPWHDPEFSKRMLVEHLSQEHDLASRRTEIVDAHVQWGLSTVLGSRPARVLDLGCGPGLYALRLARNGCESVGVDFSPASIRHAEEVAVEQGLPCRFVHADLREVSFGLGFDLVMMVYGQFNVFPRDRALEILKKAHAALQPGGHLLLELQSTEQIRKSAEAGPSWYSARSGLFSDAPHLVLQENSWDDGASASTNRFFVIDAESGAVSSYALSNEAYTEQELDETLRTAGFADVQRFPSLSGESAPGTVALPVVVARR